MKLSCLLPYSFTEPPNPGLPGKGKRNSSSRLEAPLQRELRAVRPGPSRSRLVLKSLVFPQPQQASLLPRKKCSNREVPLVSEMATSRNTTAENAEHRRKSLAKPSSNSPSSPKSSNSFAPPRTSFPCGQLRLPAFFLLCPISARLRLIRRTTPVAPFLFRA